jgi:hypothetical protein
MKKTVTYQDVPDEFRELAQEVAKPKMMPSGSDLFANNNPGTNTQKLQMV